MTHETTERHINIGEPGDRQENLAITAQSLANDNRQNASFLLEEWNEARLKGELTAFERCGDARLKTIGKNSISVSSIAAAGIPPEKLASDRGIRKWVELTHLDGETIIPGAMPWGCGGLLAKGNEESVDGTEIAPYVAQVIKHEDPFVQSIRSAERIADMSEKPVAAWAIDHLTDVIYPIAIFRKRGKTIRKISAIREYDIADYDPAKIYAEGLPTIDESEMPDEFLALLEQNEKERQEILARYPDLSKMQKTQNPRIVFFSTDIRSVRKFPTYAKIPGITFKIFTNREKVGGDVAITPENLTLAFRQLWYPLHHAVEHYGDPTKSFSNTDRFVIETPDLNLSREVWGKASEKPWVKKWIELPDRKVILLQTNAGQVNDAAEISM